MAQQKYVNATHLNKKGSFKQEVISPTRVLNTDWIDILIEEQHHISGQWLDHEAIRTEPIR